MKRILPIFLLAALAGCDSTEREIRREQAEQRQTIMELQEKQDQLHANLESTQMENDRLTKQIDELRAQLQDSRQSSQTYSQDIARLDELVQKMNTAREKDRQIILDQVSSELARIQQKTASASPPREKTSQKTEVGYEHAVKKGETIFAIAKAYGVSSKAILKANNLKADAPLKVGQVLFIPKN